MADLGIILESLSNSKIMIWIGWGLIVVLVYSGVVALIKATGIFILSFKSGKYYTENKLLKYFLIAFCYGYACILFSIAYYVNGKIKETEKDNCLLAREVYLKAKSILPEKDLKNSLIEYQLKRLEIRSKECS